MIYDSFSDIVNRIKEKFEGEKEEMARGEEKLLILLRETCSKI